MAISIETSFESEHSFMFISYSHRDEAFVEQVVEELKNRGCNLWMDRMIHAQEKWAERIAEMIEQCDVMLCFITRSYLDSKTFCMKEMAYAKNLNKKILPVFLESVELPKEWKMHFTDEQYLVSNKQACTRNLADKILDSTYIEACILTPVKMSAKEDNHSASDSTGLRRNTRALLRKRILLTTVLLILLTPFFLIGKHLFDNNGKQILTVSDEFIDAQFLKDMYGMRNLEKIEFQNCTFSDELAQSEWIPDTLLHFSADQCSGIRNLDALSGLSSLLTLRLRNCGITNSDLDFSFPSGLQYADLSGNPELSSLSCLIGCSRLIGANFSGTDIQSIAQLSVRNLESLDISRTQISSIDVLSDASRLYHILAEETKITSLLPLSKMEKLREIDFSNCPIIIMPKEFVCLRLTRLDLSNNNLADINAFANCTILEDVDLAGNDIKDISILKKSAANLKKLNLSGNPISYEAITELLQQCSLLTELRVDGIPLSVSPTEPSVGLSAVSHLKELSVLSVSGCGLYNMKGLYDFRNLSYLDLSDNNIRYLEPIPEQINHLDLNLMNNPFDAITWQSATQLRYLALYIPAASAPTELQVDSYGDGLIISSNFTDEELISIGKNFSKVYIVDCPLDRRVVLEDAIGLFDVIWISEKEIPEILTEWNMQ